MALICPRGNVMRLVRGDEFSRARRSTRAERPPIVPSWPAEWTESMIVGLSTPKTVQRDERSYLGIHAVVTMATIDETVQVLIRDVLGRPDVMAAATGAPLVRYDVIDMERELAIQVGVPVSPGTPGDDRLVAGILPAGRYLAATHTGPYDDLENATGAFRAWAGEHGYRFDVRSGDGGEVWGCRLEHYPTDPVEEPDPSCWETVLEFRLRD
jgi:effector-binding domain-containing protein